MCADLTQELQERVAAAARSGEPIEIVGGGTKRFLGRRPTGSPVHVAAHRGIVNYEPVELVLTARCGTPLSEIEQALADQSQMLAFEPPQFGGNATLGGTIAAGLSGPRRFACGAARDFVLGCKLVNGNGELLHFGGEVMKNVAGYDVSRLMTAAFGTLGLLLEISLKVLPRPESELTLVQRLAAPAALRQVNKWAGRPLPITATCHDGEHLYLRLSGTHKAIAAAGRELGGDALANAEEFWTSLREQQHPFFVGSDEICRLSVAPATSPLPLSGEWLYEWGGAQRWLKTEMTIDSVRAVLARTRGHATLFRTQHRDAEIFHPLPAKTMALHQALKHAFDSKRILNPGRLYAGL